MKYGNLLVPPVFINTNNKITDEDWKKIFKPKDQKVDKCQTMMPGKTLIGVKK